MAEFLYPSPYAPSEVLARLRTAAGHPPAADSAPAEHARGSRVVVVAEGSRFRVHLARPGRRQWNGPVAAGDVRAGSGGSELAGVIRASRVDLAGSIAWLGFLFWMGWRTGEPVMAVLTLGLGTAFVAATFPWADEEREEALHAVLAAAATPAGVVGPEIAARDG